MVNLYNRPEDLTLIVLIYLLYSPWRPKGFVQFEIIINVLVSPFRLILIHMFWVYDHYNFFNSLSTRTVFRR